MPSRPHDGSGPKTDASTLLRRDLGPIGKGCLGGRDRFFRVRLPGLRDPPDKSIMLAGIHRVDGGRGANPLTVDDGRYVDRDVAAIGRVDRGCHR